MAERDMRENALTRMIARLTTQRACLDFAAGLIRDLPGPVLEIGLGKARTFDHLRSLFPQRALFAFDREVHCSREIAPAPEQLKLGDFRKMLKEMGATFGTSVALAHADIGSHDRAGDAALAAEIAPLIGLLMRPGGVVLGDRAFDGQGWEILPLPPDATGWPYFIYRKR
jgi:S-adenosylmethionine-dependent methyltransferase